MEACRQIVGRLSFHWSAILYWEGASKEALYIAAGLVAKQFFQLCNGVGGELVFIGHDCGSASLPSLIEGNFLGKRPANTP